MSPEPGAAQGYERLWKNPMYLPDYVPCASHCEELVPTARSVAGLNHRIKLNFDYGEKAFLPGSYMIGYETSNRQPNECYVFTLSDHVSYEDGIRFMMNIPEDEKVSMIITGKSFTHVWANTVRDNRSGATHFLINQEIPWFKRFDSPTP